MIDRVIVTRPVCGLIAMQVCAVVDATDEEILTVCNRDNPAGTSLGWAQVYRAEGEKQSPMVCEDYPERKHFIVYC